MKQALLDWVKMLHADILKAAVSRAFSNIFGFLKTK
jgi:hypothetical protein